MFVLAAARQYGCMADINIIYEVKAEVDHAVNNIRRVNDEVKNLSQSVDRQKAGLGGMFSGLAGAVSKILGAAAALKGLQTALSEAAAYHANIRQLEVALKGVGKTEDEIRAITSELLEFSEKLSMVTAVDDDVIFGLVKLGVQMGYTVDEAKELTKMALNIASTFGMDVQTAFIQLSKQLATGESLLTRYDANLKALNERGASNAEVIEYLSRTYGGMAKASGELNALAKVQISLNNILQSFGNILLPVINLVGDLSMRLSGMLSPALSRLEGVVRSLMPVFGMLADAVGRALEFITSRVGWVLGGIGKVAEAIRGVLESVGAVETGNVEVLAKRQQALVYDVIRHLNARGKEFQKLSEGFVRELLSGNVGAMMEFSRIAGKSLLPRDYDLVIDFVGRASREYQELARKIREAGKESKKHADISAVDVEKLKNIERVVDKNTRAKRQDNEREKEALKLLSEKMEAIKKILEYSEKNNMLSDELRSVLSSELEVLRQAEINLNGLRGSFGEITNRIKAANLTSEEWRAVLSNITLADLITDLEEINKKLDSAGKNTEQAADLFKQLGNIIDDVVRVVDALSDGLEKIGLLSGEVASDIRGYVNAISGIVKGVAGGDAVGAAVGAISLVSQAISDIVGAVNFYNQSLPAVVENTARLQAEITLLNSEAERLRESLGNVADIGEITRLHNRLVNVLEERYRRQAEIVNGYYNEERRAIERQIADLQSKLRSLNDEMARGGDKSAIRREIEEITREIRRLQEELGRVTVNPNINLMTREQIERQRQSIENEVRNLQRRKAALQDFLNWLRENRGGFGESIFGVNMVAKDLWSRYAGIVNTLREMNIISEEQRKRFLDNAGVARDVNDLISILENRINNINGQLESQNALLQSIREWEGLRAEFVKYVSESYDKQVRLLDVQNRKQEAINKLQEKARFLSDQIARLKAEGKNTADFEIEYYETMNEITERQKRLQEEVNKLIDDRINKLKKIIELGGLDVENIKDIQTIMEFLEKQGLEGTKLLGAMSDLGIRVSREFVNKGMVDVSRELHNLLGEVFSVRQVNQTTSNVNVSNFINFSGSLDYFNSLVASVRGLFGRSWPFGGTR